MGASTITPRTVIRANTPAVDLAGAARSLAECGHPEYSEQRLRAMCEKGELDWFPIRGHGIFIPLAELTPLGLSAAARSAR